MKLLSNTLYIVSTPIGNLEDITLRAINVLKNSDIILCEDTRHSIKLLNHLSIKKKLIPYHKFNEKKQIRFIIEHINQGKILSLVSDAGTPLLSDPGKVIVNECLKKNISVVPIPGVSSITAATSISGFSDKFLFYGFLPKTEKKIDTILNSLSLIDHSIIFFIPSVKTDFYFKKFNEFFSGRKIMIAKEITKVHEEFIRDEVKNLKTLKKPLISKGEITVVVSENNIKAIQFDKEKIINKAKIYLKKYSLKDTVDLIIKSEKIKKKKEIYSLCLKLKNEKNN